MNHRGHRGTQKGIDVIRDLSTTAWGFLIFPIKSNDPLLCPSVPSVVPIQP